MDIQVKACRVCLNTDVKMVYIGNILQYYISLLANDKSYGSFPHHICFECKSLLVKFIKFRRKYILAQSLLSKMLKEYDEVTEQDIKEIHLATPELRSPFSQKKLSPTSLSEITCRSPEQLIMHEETKAGEWIKPKLNLDDEIIHYDGDNIISVEEVEDIVENEKTSNNTILLDDAKPNSEETLISNLYEVSDDEVMLVVVADDPTDEEADENGSLLELVTKVENKEPSMKRKPEPNKAEEPKPKRANDTSSIPKIKVELSNHFNIVRLTMEQQLAQFNKRKHSANYLNSPYQCKQCYKGFIHTQAWKHHLRSHSLSAGNHECTICKARFHLKHELNKHSKNVHEMEYICKICFEVSKTEVKAKQHLNWHDGVTYKCQHCDEVFIKWTSYFGHVRKKHPSDFVCAMCGFSFISEKGLSLHKKRIHKNLKDKNLESDGETEPGPYCKECDITFMSVEAWNRHMITSDKHKDTMLFDNLCRVCGKTFGTAIALRLHHKQQHARVSARGRRHQRRLDITWPLHCKHCSEELFSAEEYSEHHQIYHPKQQNPLIINRMYVCKICDKPFNTKEELVSHKLMHAQEKRFVCGLCGAAFRKHANMQLHKVQVHSHLRPFVCGHCGVAFKRYDTLKRHSKLHEDGNTRTCEKCNKTFSKNSNTPHCCTGKPKPMKRRTRRRSPCKSDTTVTTDSDS